MLAQPGSLIRRCYDLKGRQWGRQGRLLGLYCVVPTTHYWSSPIEVRPVSPAKPRQSTADVMITWPPSHSDISLPINRNIRLETFLSILLSIFVQTLLSCEP